MMTTISQREAEIASCITAPDKQLAEVNAKFGALRLAKTEPDDTEVDRAGAISQVAVEQAVLRESHANYSTSCSLVSALQLRVYGETRV